MGTLGEKCTVLMSLRRPLFRNLCFGRLFSEVNNEESGHGGSQDDDGNKEVTRRAQFVAQRLRLAAGASMAGPALGRDMAVGAARHI